MGAYASSTDRIYLAQSLLGQPDRLTSVLLEEIGHSIDARINPTDTPGDEGELFAALVEGRTLTDAQLARIHTEDDRAVITLDGQEISVEQATFTVINLNDSGAGTLRQALLDANGSAGADTIVFQTGLSGTIVLLSGGLTITDSVTIDGDINNDGIGDITVQQSGAVPFRVFNIDDGTATVLDVTLDGLTIQNGRAQNGAGIFNAENLTLTNSTVRGNVATNLRGGGIYNTGTATLINSTVSGNGAGTGGGIYNTGTVTLTNSTVSGNGIGSGSGGGIFNSGTVTLTNSTVSGNSADSFDGSGSGSGGGGIFNAGTVTLTSTIVGDNTASSILDFSNLDLRNSGGTIHASYSLIENDSNQINGINSNNIFGQDPRLGSLQNNGGLTQTIALLADSPAINAGSNPNTLTTDQRGTGFDRIVGGTIDIGAFEFVPPPGVTIAQSGGSTNIAEGGATDTYTIVLNSQPTANVTIALTPDSQSTTSPTSLVFTPANWNIAQTVTVTAVDDAAIEGNHTSTISHTATSSDDNYNRISITSVTANITDNDEITGITVVGAGITPTTPVLANDSLNVDFRITNTGNDTTSFRIPNFVAMSGSGNQVGDVQVSIDGGTTFTTIAGSELITSSIAAGGSVLVRVNVTVNSGATPGQVISVKLGNTAGDAQNVSRITDASDVFTVDLSDGDPGEVTGIPANGVREASATQTIAVTSIPTVNLSVTTNTGTEAGATVITVTATASSAVSGNQTVGLGVIGANITAGDYSLSNNSITILDGQTTGSVTFTIVDDALVEGNETATLTIK